MKAFFVVACTSTTRLTFTALTRSSCDAVILANELLGDQPCRITVRPA